MGTEKKKERKKLPRPYHKKRRTKAMAAGQFHVLFGQMGATQVLSNRQKKNRDAVHAVQTDRKGRTIFFIMTTIPVVPTLDVN
jgi:hypothetical protein